jgi:hypothetical protein
LLNPRECKTHGPAASRTVNTEDDLVPAPADPADEQSNWQCLATAGMPIDQTDDPFDAVRAKSELLAKFSPAGTISAEAAKYFFAYDAAAPYAAESYLFPFCAVTGGTIVASKVGWRASYAALTKSDLPENVASAAYFCVQQLEDRLRDTIEASWDAARDLWR